MKSLLAIIAWVVLVGSAAAAPQNAASPAAADSAVANMVAPPAAKPVAPTPANATPPAAPDTAPPPAPTTAAAPVNPGLSRLTLTQIESQLPTVTDDGKLTALGEEASAIQAQAESAATPLEASIAQLNRQLQKVSPRKGHRPTAEEKREEAPILAQLAPLQADLRKDQSLAAAAAQTFRDVAERRREGFSARLLERTASPLTPDFWGDLVEASSADLARLEGMLFRSVDAAVRAPEPRGLIGAGLGLLLALVILVPVWRWLERVGEKFAARAGTQGGFTRSAAAVWFAVVETGAPAFAANMVHFGLNWGGLLSPVANTLAGALVGAVTWSAAILALGRAFATVLDPEHRLADMSDPRARRIQFSLWAVAVVTSIGFVLKQVNYAVGASLAATIASNCVLSLAYAAVSALILVSFQRGRTTDSSTEAARQPIWTLISLALAAAIILTVASVLSGYTTLASLISGQIFWLSLIGAVTFVIIKLVDDGLGFVFRPGGRTTRTLATLFSLRVSTILQAGLLTSAILQLLILGTAATLALTPFGQSGDQLFAHLSQFGSSIQIGKVKISPIAVAEGVGVFAAGMALVHLVRGWVTRRYLPVTDWDSGVRNSVTTGVGYLGLIVTLISAFSAMGLGFQQIALIASALSVGIGFGLQTIVQNFVAGVILLVERPVKVGDWIDLGSGVEGDVRRIRVRATEIQTFDRSTVIVPNSTFITANVRNKTLGNPRGRMELKLMLAKAGDTAKARDLVLEAAKTHKEVIEDPKPTAFVDSTGNAGSVNLKAFAYVANPRDAYRVRSELYLDIIERYEAAGIVMGGA